MGQLELQIPVAKAAKVDGVEMGVLEGGVAFLSSNGLAAMCGVAVSTILNQKTTWASGARKNKLARLLLERGYCEAQLCISTKHKGTSIDAYTEAVCLTVLEYYAFEAGENCTEKAKASFRTLAQRTFRAFIYSMVGYAPVDDWRHIHDRLLLNPVPAGYFSVLQEAASFLLAVKRAGLSLDHETVPDISIGIRWRSHWVDHGLDEVHGPSAEHVHNFPPDTPQARSNPQDIHIYPVHALGTFRDWIETVYIPESFPDYLKGKVKKGKISEGRATQLLEAVDPRRSRPLPAKPPVKRLPPQGTSA